MAWSFTAHRGSASSKTSGAVLSISPTGTVAAGAILVAVCVSDNIATGGGVTQTHVVADFKGNPWQKVREQSNAAPAASGITLSVWACQVTAPLTASDLIVLGLAAAVTSRAVGLYEYAVGAGNGVSFAGASSGEQDATASPAATLSGLASQSYAFFGVAAREDDTAGTYTPGANYNDRTKFGTTGGTGNTNVSCIVGDRVATLTGSTFAPTALSVAADVVTVLIAMREVTEFPQKTVTVSFSGGSMFVTVDSETIDVEPAYARALMQGQGKRLDCLLYAIAGACTAAGIDPTNTAAVASYINGRTFQF